MALDNTVDIFSMVIGMKFGMRKCAKVIVHRGNFEPAEGIPTSTGRITDVETDKGCNHLGVLQINENTQSKIKDETNIHQKITQVLKRKING